MCEGSIVEDPSILEFVPDKYKMQEMCKKAVEEDAHALEFVPDQYKTPEMCEKSVKEDPYALEFVPDHYKNKEMCEKEVDAHLPILEFDPDKCKTKKCVMKLRSFIYVPDWFLTQEQVKIWHGENFGWYDNFKKRKAQKAKIKEELIANCLASHENARLLHDRRRKGSNKYLLSEGESIR